MALNSQLLGKRIQQRRSELKISQLKFAELIDTSPAFVSRLEHGEKGPSLETLVLIANVLDTPVDTLLSESRTPTQPGNAAEMAELLNGCSAFERFVLLQCMKELKRILREGAPLQPAQDKL